MSTITEFRAGILAMLDDASASRFTADEADQGLRMALHAYSSERPLIQAVNLEGQGVYTLQMPAGLYPLAVCGVRQHKEETAPPLELRFTAYEQDGDWFIELVDFPLFAGESVDVTYAADHTVEGLDSAEATSVPGGAETALQMGAAGFAALIRSMSRAESVTLQPNAAITMADLSKVYLEKFFDAIQPAPTVKIASLPPAPVN